MGENFTGWIGIVGLILFLLWVTIPFAVFGIKPILRDILKELKEMNQNIKSENVNREMGEC